ncbi:glutathione binding-like protein [Photorhabdus bodei]|uniref:glutathione binding-like protein n=1 Tax=Photorhabdus bodei TaxID=2029681 RepID=UPI001EE3BD6A|nr:glutathione binding-like protein [Photorhabdus bodei]
MHRDVLRQRVHFGLFVTEKNHMVIQRYRCLTEEAFSTLNKRLSDRPFFAGDEYSIADIANFGWTHIARIIDFDFRIEITDTQVNLLKSFIESLLFNLYPMDFKMHRDGKGVNPREHR